MSKFIVCKNITCQNNGECTYSKKENKGVCRCDPRFAGKFCELKKGKLQLFWCINCHCRISTWVFLSFNTYLSNLCFLVNGAWGQWSEKTTCTASCAGGVITRNRKCDRPQPSDGGSKCPGKGTEVTPCAEYPCEGKFFNFWTGARFNYLECFICDCHH